MKSENLKNKIQQIVQQACELKNKYTTEIDAPVNYVCIFCHSENEFNEYKTLALNLGSVLEETYSGPLFKIKPLQTISGELQILKIRMPDNEHLDLGDADFTVSNYPTFKKMYLNKPGFKLIERPKMEMIELIDTKFSTRVYFSNPPLDKQFKLK